MAVGFACSGIALFCFLRRVDGEALLSAIGSANLLILSISLLTKIAVLSLNAMRTQILLLPLRRYGFFECFLPWLSGYVTDNLLPFRLGELVRIDLLARAGRISRSSTIAVVGLDRLIDLMSLLVLLAIAAPILAVDLGNANRLFMTSGVVVACLATVLWLALHPTAVSRIVAVLVRPLRATAQQWLVDKAQRFSEGLGALRSRTMVLSVLGVTFVARAVGVLSIQCWLWAFGLSLPLYAPLVILLFISVGTMIPSSPGFIGTFHVACAYALELMGVAPEIAASVAIAGHFVSTVPWTIVGLFVSFPGIRRVWQQERESIRPAEQLASM
jgi:glycosyltransferase 2 family protein